MEKSVVARIRELAGPGKVIPVNGESVGKLAMLCVEAADTIERMTAAYMDHVESSRPWVLDEPHEVVRPLP